MYKVFLNDKIILPGMEDPSLAPSEGISLRPGCPARELNEALARLAAVEGIRVLRIGQEGEAREAWELLAYCLGHESAAGGFVLNAEDRLLMIHRNGYWDLPKGKPHAGEELQATALREVEEETGIGGLTIIGRLRPSYHVFEKLGQWVLKESLWYLMRSQDTAPPVPQGEEGITEVRWVSTEEYLMLRPTMFPSLHEVADLGWIQMGIGR